MTSPFAHRSSQDLAALLAHLADRHHGRIAAQLSIWQLEDPQREIEVCVAAIAALGSVLDMIARNTGASLDELIARITTGPPTGGPPL